MIDKYESHMLFKVIHFREVGTSMCRMFTSIYHHPSSMRQSSNALET